MMDPINLVHAYHATREVHREYVRDKNEQPEANAEGRVRRPRLVTWLRAVLAAIPGERRLASARRRHA